MQGRLADADRRVGPDEVVGRAAVDCVRGHGRDVGEAEGGGVAVGEVDAAFVDIDAKDLCVFGEEAERERDGTPAAADVEKAAGGRGIGHFFEEDGRALVDATGAEDAGRDLHRDAAPGKRDGQRAALIRARWRSGEVVVPRIRSPRVGHR